MTPRSAIEKLNRQIKAHGQSATLTHFGDDGRKSEHPLQVFLRGYMPNELGGGIDQGDSAVVISALDWSALGLSELPAKLDRVFVAGRVRTIQNVDQLSRMFQRRSSVHFPLNSPNAANQGSCHR